MPPKNAKVPRPHPLGPEFDPGGEHYAPEDRRIRITALFDAWRRKGANATHRSEDWKPDDRYKHPKKWGRYTHPPQPVRGYGMERPLFPISEVWTGPGFEPGNETMDFLSHETAPQVVKNLEESLAAGGLELLKVLGWGGQGIACLFGYDRDDGTKELFVAKGILDDDEDGWYAEEMHKEKKRLGMCEGAMHVCQLKSIQSRTGKPIVVKNIFVSDNSSPPAGSPRLPTTPERRGVKTSAGDDPDTDMEDVQPPAEETTPNSPQGLQKRKAEDAGEGEPPAKKIMSAMGKRAQLAGDKNWQESITAKRNGRRESRADRRYRAKNMAGRPKVLAKVGFVGSGFGLGGGAPPPSGGISNMLAQQQQQQQQRQQSGILQALAQQRQQQQQQQGQAAQPSVLQALAQLQGGTGFGVLPAFAAATQQQVTSPSEPPVLAGPYPPGAIPRALRGLGGRDGPGSYRSVSYPFPLGRPALPRPGAPLSLGQARFFGIRSFSSPLEAMVSQLGISEGPAGVPLMGPGGAGAGAGFGPLGSGVPGGSGAPAPPPPPPPDDPSPSSGSNQDPDETGNFFVLNPVRQKVPDLGPKNVMIMEYLQHNTLAHFHWTIHKRKMKIPSRTLWYIFFCLIKGLIGLNYPPQRYHKRHADISRDSLWSESMPSKGRLPADGGTHLVHFDLDPTNIFIGSLDAPSAKENNHSLCPIMKLGDFGIAERFPPTKAHRANELWEQRVICKNKYMTPEAFTQEWDWIEQAPVDSRRSHQTAGRYGSHTNVYQVALIMCVLITQHEPQIPPVPKLMTLTDIAVEQWRGQQGQSDPAAERPNVTGWNYGSYIFEDNPGWQHVDKLLRLVVTHCMFDVPDLRPSLTTLYTIALRRLKFYQNASDNVGPDPDKWEEKATCPMDWAEKSWQQQPVWTDSKLKAFIKEVLENPVV